MSKNTVNLFKLFWADQDPEQEQWLGEMARRGMHLQSVNTFYLWTFVKGDNADVAYRVDYHNKGKHSEYHRLFEDAGWERAAELSGWQYWRKRVVDGHSPQIFTDRESIADKYRRVLEMLATVILSSTVVLISCAYWDLEKYLRHPYLIVLHGVLAATIPFNMYMALRLYRRMREVCNVSA